MGMLGIDEGEKVIESAGLKEWVGNVNGMDWNRREERKD